MSKISITSSKKGLPMGDNLQRRSKERAAHDMCILNHYSLKCNTMIIFTTKHYSISKNTDLI